MDKITDNVFLGSVDDANIHLRRNNFLSPIDAVLCVAWDITGEQYPLDIDNSKPIIKVGLVDMDGNNLKSFGLAVEQLDLLVQKDFKVLVHCAAGISRSPTVVSTYLAMKNNWKLEDSVSFLVTKRSCVDPHRGILKTASDYLISQRGWA